MGTRRKAGGPATSNLKTSDFNKKGKFRFEEVNTRKNAEWIEFACTKEEIEIIMQSIGLAIGKTDLKKTSAGSLLAGICRYYLRSFST